MKRQVQESGDRKWYGSDHAQMQNELFEAIESHYEPYGNLIVKGCAVSDNGNGTWNVGSGLVALFAPDKSEYRVCRFAGQDTSDTHDAIYLTLTSTETKEEYVSGGIKTIVKEYSAHVNTVLPANGEYLTINKNGSNLPTYRNAIQSAMFRFVTDNEKNTWSNKEPAIVKKSGFNLEKSDTAGDFNTNKLATEKLASELDLNIYDLMQDMNNLYNNYADEAYTAAQDAYNEAIDALYTAYDNKFGIIHEDDIQDIRISSSNIDQQIDSVYVKADCPNGYMGGNLVLPDPTTIGKVKIFLDLSPSSGHDSQIKTHTGSHLRWNGVETTCLVYEWVGGKWFKTSECS